MNGKHYMHKMYYKQDCVFDYQGFFHLKSCIELLEAIKLNFPLYSLWDFYHLHSEKTILFEEFPIQAIIPAGIPNEAGGRVRFKSLEDHTLDKKK